MRAAISVAALVLLAGCIDFREGLACGRDADCLGYLCVNAVCQAPPSATSAQVGGGAGGSGGASGSGGAVGGGGGGSGGSGGGMTATGTETVAAGQSDAISLRQDGTTLFWLTQEGGRLKVRKALKSANSSGAEVADLGPFSSVKRPVMVVGTDALFVAAGSHLSKVSKTGGPPTVLATSGGADFGGGIGIAGSTLVWLSPGQSATVWKMALAGGPTQQVSANETNAESLVASGTFVYWTVRDGIALFDLGTGTTRRSTSAGLLAPTGLAVSGTSVSWLESEAASYLKIFSTPIGAGTATSFTMDNEVLAATTDGAGTIYAVSRATESFDDTGLYAINIGSGATTYVRATGGNSLVGGVATEVLVDADNVYLVVQNLILRRRR